MNEDNTNLKPLAVPPSSDEAAAELSTASVHRAAVLVVDDSRTMRLALIRALNGLGFHNITEAANGRQAVELVLSKPFDLMLLDLEMPEMNGMEVLVAIKTNRFRKINSGFVLGRRGNHEPNACSNAHNAETNPRKQQRRAPALPLFDDLRRRRLQHHLDRRRRPRLQIHQQFAAPTIWSFGLETPPLT
ncbi:MAG TPA: response regulator, partial [Verrucomicrobiota bacterium]|nr:response regulator [Verrucomicrobiota bacterium]